MDTTTTPKVIWEYCYIYSSGIEDAMIKLNQMGAQGWEVFYCSNGYYLLKRSN